MLQKAAKIPSLIALLFIRAYQLSLSGLIGRQCRYLPSCSQFSYEAIQRFGLWRGSQLSFLRLLSCHPWGGAAYDPVPEKAEDYRAKFKYCRRRKHII